MPTFVLMVLLMAHGTRCQEAVAASQDLVRVIVTDAQVGVGDKDSSSGITNWIDLKHGPSASTSPEATQMKLQLIPAVDLDETQKLTIRFSLKDAATNSFVSPHQVFILLTNKNSKREIVYLADEVVVDASKDPQESSVGMKRNFKLDLVLGNRRNQLSGDNGIYDVSLIVGDDLISNSFIWNLLSVNINSGLNRDVTSSESTNDDYYKPKKEIHHVFRTPDKRPSFVVSDAFSLLVIIIPYITLIIFWSKIGINLSGFNLNQLFLPSFMFHTSLFLIFSLYFMFWLEFNMFTTLKCLMALGVVTFMSGHSLLSKIHSKKSA